MRFLSQRYILQNVLHILTVLCIQGCSLHCSECILLLGCILGHRALHSRVAPHTAMDISCIVLPGSFRVFMHFAVTPDLCIFCISQC